MTPGGRLLTLQLAPSTDVAAGSLCCRLRRLHRRIIRWRLSSQATAGRDEALEQLRPRP